MVDVLGHLGMALFFLAPVWLVLRETQVSLIFVGVFVWFGMFPDVDLYLSNWFAGIHHHGVFHTVLAVSIAAVIIGPILGWVFVRLAERVDPLSRSMRTHEIVIGVAGVWVAGISHLVADMLSAPDVSQRIEPLWPLYDGPIVLVDVLWYQSVWARWGLLALGVGLNVALWYWHSARNSRRSTVPPTG